MTMKSFGNITPLQGEILVLAGYGPSKKDGERDLVLQDTDAEKVAAIINGRELLMRASLKDFGCSLKDWHNYLLSSEKNKREYTFPYSWEVVKKAVLAQIANPDRARLEALAEEITKSEN